MSERPLIPLKQAREILGVSHTTMARLVKEGRFRIYQNPLDRRQKLVDRGEIEAFAAPIPFSEEDGAHQLDPEAAASAPVVAEPSAAEHQDDELAAALQLLRLLLRAGRTDPDAPFIQTQSGDLIHPGITDGRVNVPPAIFNRLLREGFIRILQGVYHRRGADVGREFVITPEGHEGLTNH
ncbi:MAG: helix-turn-helix transcriptional regulator [Chloroflexota bacterium]